MTDKIAPIFIDSSPRLPLLNNHGRDFMGLENSSSPELVERTKNLFEYLNERLGFLIRQKGGKIRNILIYCFDRFIQK